MPWDGVEVALDVVFEPEIIGTLKSELRVSSSEGGVFVWPIFGQCDPARPRGPFPIAKGATVAIDVKNVLREDKDFVLTCDNPCFSVPSPSIRIGAKKSVQVAVKYTPAEGAPNAGKLIVSCPSVPELQPWVFYVSGL